MSATTTRRRLAEQLVREHGRLFSEELGIKLAKGTPSPLFRWLCASLLYSARISQDLASAAARRLAEEGWTTVEKMAGSSWEQRVRALNGSGYARYDESTARMLGELCSRLTREYQADLRNLRERAARDPEAERRLLKEFKGIGDTGADIFFREVQFVWKEHSPFADKRSLKAASRLGLGANAKDLHKLAGRESDFPRLLAALVRVETQDLYDEL